MKETFQMKKRSQLGVIHKMLLGKVDIIYKAKDYNRALEDANRLGERIYMGMCNIIDNTKGERDRPVVLRVSGLDPRRIRNEWQVISLEPLERYTATAWAEGYKYRKVERLPISPNAYAKLYRVLADMFPPEFYQNLKDTTLYHQIQIFIEHLMYAFTHTATNKPYHVHTRNTLNDFKFRGVDAERLDGLKDGEKRLYILGYVSDMVKEFSVHVHHTYNRMYLADRDHYRDLMLKEGHMGSPVVREFMWKAKEPKETKEEVKDNG